MLQGFVDVARLLSLGPVSMPLSDLLRLVAVVVFAWAAYRDVLTRRVPNRTWLPLVVVGLVALAIDTAIALDAGGFQQRIFVVRVLVSLLLVGSMGYVFWRLGGFGGADAKALMTLALVYPAYPTVIVQGTSVTLPVLEATLQVFSLTILTNTVLVGLASPFALALRNALAGRFRLAMFVGRPVSLDDLPTAYGRLLETPEGFTRSGLDIDALRMYLRWRGTTLATLRAAPAEHRDPASIGETYAPGDGSLAQSGEELLLETDGGSGAGDEFESAVTTVADGAVDTPEDPWGAARFLASIDGSAYGTTPDALCDGLEVLAQDDREAVLVTPGMPFIVPMFVGLVLALTVGDVLFGLLALVGLV